jgi:hypothetical protein
MTYLQTLEVGFMCLCQGPSVPGLSCVVAIPWAVRAMQTLMFGLG